MLKYLSSLLWGDSDTVLTLEEAYSVLENPQQDPEEASTKQHPATEGEYCCYHKTGVITSKNGQCYSIDSLYEFDSDLTNLEVGLKVSFTVFDSGGLIKVSNIVILDDWFLESVDSTSTWCIRSIICKISKREGRTVFVTPGDLKIDLNDVAAEFIPVIGDWVDVEAKVELDQKVSDLFGKILEVLKISPLRPRIIQGTIKDWSVTDRTGCIDRIATFNHEALIVGYIPVIGDKVVAEIIESDQGRFTYRALKVVFEGQKVRQGAFGHSSKTDFDIVSDFISVSSDIDINSNKLGEKIVFAFDVVNKSNEAITLLSVTIESNTPQSVFSNTDGLSNIPLHPSKNVRFEGCCTIKNVGVSKELVLFTFTNCKIGRWITINMQFHTSVLNKPQSTIFNKLRYTNTKFRQDNSMIRGQRNIVPPRFISARLPDYAVSQKLLDLVVKYKDGKQLDLLDILRTTKPCLTQTLSHTNYEDRFHTLIHLEEISEIISMRSYACDLTCFIRNNEFLMLEIENLSERRPSLMVGDRIIAKDPYCNDADEYEGFIHKIGAKHVYIKFSASYHERYNGEDVSIIAIASRSTFRRMHQAVGLAIKNLGNLFLFPLKVDIKEPQVLFTYDTYSKELNQNNDDIVEKFQNEQLEKNIKSMLLLEDDPNDKQNYESKINNPQRNVKLEWYNRNLNYYQKEAVRNILIGEARPLPYMIFGPPGTGKTITLVETILQILRLIPHSRLLVATPTNSAADLIALRLIDSGVLRPGDLIRLVAYRCVVEDMLPLKLIPYCATADIAKEGTRERNFTAADNGLTLGCNSSVIGRHRITIGTSSALGVLFNMSFAKGHFTHIVVDEAGQLTEPDIMIPLAFLDVLSGQVILAGDPMQLGPILCSGAATSYGLDETYLDRLLNRFPYTRDPHGFPETAGYDPRLVTKLIYNYRSLPEILKLTSNLFYEGELLPTISQLESKEADLLKQVQEILPYRKTSMPPAVVFHGVLGENYQTADSPSWFNPSEASQIFFYVNELYRLGLKSTDIGIISPYIKQVRQIRALMVEAEFNVPKVGTVEEFQGQEFPVILLSTVRSNEDLVSHDLVHKLGFLSIPKRVNVAISRARALLIVVGNPEVLCIDIHWRSVIKYCIENNSYCGCDLSGIR